VGKNISKITALVLAGLFLPSLAWAAGLGKLTVFSGLGEPLRAEIEVSSTEPGEADSLSARLAGGETYRQANIERQSALTSIRFAVDRRPGGQHVVLITSVGPMNEPFLDLLVELNWTNGRLVREYSFLLDPPEYKLPPMAAPAAPEPTAKEPAEVRAPAVVTETQLAPAPVAEPAAVYEVKRGDTLAKIAIQHKSEGVSLQQMLVALYRRNQDAFDGNNMNRLRAGKILNIPEREAAADVTQGDARAWSRRKARNSPSTDARLARQSRRLRRAPCRSVRLQRKSVRRPRKNRRLLRNPRRTSCACRRPRTRKLRDARVPRRAPTTNQRRTRRSGRPTSASRCWKRMFGTCKSWPS
jgi:pilus assembly protein FimV